MRSVLSCSSHLGHLVEGSPPSLKRADFPFGLGVSGLHELAEADHGDMAAATGLALAYAAGCGVGLWVTQYKSVQAHGRLSAAHGLVFGKRPWRNLTVRVSKKADALWAVDEAVRSRAASLIIVEVEDADFTATRRLKLASERYGVPVVMLMPYTREGASACETRWRISSLPSAPNPYDPRAPGRPRWRAMLERCRPAPHRMGEVFDLEYDDETLSLRLVSELAVGTTEAVETAGLQNARVGENLRYTG